MVKILKFLAYFSFFILALIYFIPKQSLYYAAEKELQKEKIIFSNEEIVQNAFSLELKHLDLSYASIESAKAQSVNVKLFALYNSIVIKGVELSSVASAFAPLRVERLEVRYSVLNPLNALFSANGEFGEIEGQFNIKDKNVSLILKPTPLMLNQYKSTMREFKKNERGEYEYDKIIQP